MIQIDEGKIQEHLGEVVRSAVEATLNAMLDAEADRLCHAERYERSEARKDTRAGSYQRHLQTKAGEVTLKVPKLRTLPFEMAISLRSSEFFQGPMNRAARSPSRAPPPLLKRRRNPTSALPSRGQAKLPLIQMRYQTRHRSRNPLAPDTPAAKMTCSTCSRYFAEPPKAGSAKLHGTFSIEISNGPVGVA